jgi:hypothetical protein
MDKLQQKPKDELRIEPDSKINPFPAAKQPGFEAISSIAGLSLIVYLNKNYFRMLK